VEGAGDDADAFFGEGPEAYFAGAVDESVGFAVECEVLEADDGGARCTGRLCQRMRTGFSLTGLQGSEREHDDDCYLYLAVLKMSRSAPSSIVVLVVRDAVAYTLRG
jgi:hypothetical protein